MDQTLRTAAPSDDPPPTVASDSPEASPCSPGAPAGLAEIGDPEAPEGEAKPAAKAVVKPRRKGRWRRRLLVAGGVLVVGTGGLWVAVHEIPWLGPMLADGLRFVLGKDAVARIEEFAYGVADEWKQAWKGGDAPEAYWQVPERVDPPAPVEAPGCPVEPFRPADVGPVHASFSAPGDGVWVPIETQHAGDTPRMYKTLVHPDAQRSWAAVTVVAVDMRQVDLHMVIGTQEPEAKTAEGASYTRTGIVPEGAQPELLGAFNGGFKTEHGQYGAKIDGVVLVPPRGLACFVGAFRGEHGEVSLDIGDWEAMKEREPDALWWRQTPGCIVDDGQMHALLATSEKNTYWGATLDGQTVIRRSAIGVSADKRTLYSGIGDHVTAKALAQAMMHVGATDAAQLDVNWSYPKFVVYRRDGASAELVATKLCDGFEFSSEEYVRQKSARDFFYLTRKSPTATAEAVCGPGAKPTPPTVAPAPAEGAPAEGARGAQLDAPSNEHDG